MSQSPAASAISVVLRSARSVSSASNQVQRFPVLVGLASGSTTCATLTRRFQRCGQLCEIQRRYRGVGHTITRGAQDAE